MHRGNSATAEVVFCRVKDTDGSGGSYCGSLDQQSCPDVNRGRIAQGTSWRGLLTGIMSIDNHSYRKPGPSTNPLGSEVVAHFVLFGPDAKKREPRAER
ncbi:hypothetical protein AG1IA_07400 [Rhizoctonia solani AG-1 IA]|uniref:Uncharacterized protein n=1 Tax=Thanatephorus cucumeris (strain AG1-IA) TaxID=983506 RepID=L8WP49_THACA|nr:hypothetical protein AG1IA_07400 [Rhizoctonia solani AG-1 IA]